MLLAAEEQFVKKLYNNKLKLEQIEILAKEMWEKVEVAKEKLDWDKIQKIKKEYRGLITLV